MKCPKCVENGEKSNLFGGVGMSTLMYCTPYYDEDGNYHHHDTNTTTSGFNCSNGHSFTVKSQPSCPSYPEHCDHKGSEEIIMKE